MDKLINIHINKMDKLEIDIDNEIDKAMKKITIDDIMNDPEETLIAIVQVIRDSMVEKYGVEAIDEGIKFAKAIERLKRDIKVPKTDDPNLNEEK